MALIALALGLLWSFPDAVSAQQPLPTASEILARVKAGLRASQRPAFVVYTLVRRDRIDEVPDFLNSYTLRIWCRTQDPAALSRHVSGARVSGPAEFIVPAFDKPIDPGPPTADLLDVIRQAQPPAAASPAPEFEPGTPAPPEPVLIGSVSVVIEHNYHVTYAGLDRNDYHVHLEALRDADHNRLTDLYVDRQTYALHRVVAHDHLYEPNRSVPQRFEIDFGVHDGVPVITAIHGETDYALADRGEPLHIVDYRFENVVFPSELPAWYFEPAHYGEHRAEFPFDVRN